jgi:hypothetical protein
MSTKTHTTIMGHTIEYEATPKVTAFLKRLLEIANDPEATENDLVGVAYSSENPFLDHKMFPGRGGVTREILDSPVYAVMTDIIFRKRIAQDGVDVEKLLARYSMSVGEAAAELGIHESAVRQAIGAKRLASVLRDGKHYLDPRALTSFEVSNRGPRKRTAPAEPVPEIEHPDPPIDREAVLGERPESEGAELDVVLGHEKGLGLKIRPSLPKVERLAGNRMHGRLERGWKRAVVMTTGQGGTRRAFVLEPGPEENEIKHGAFAVRGRFVVAEKGNTPSKADEIWDNVGSV